MPRWTAPDARTVPREWSPSPIRLPKNWLRQLACLLLQERARKRRPEVRLGVETLEQRQLPTITLQMAPLGSPAENSAWTSQKLATFTTTDATQNFQATVQWGDGSSSSAMVGSMGSGTFGVFSGHTYSEEGNDAIQLTVQDDKGSSASGSSTVTVSDPAVQASGGFHYTATEGQALTNLQLLTFTDPAGGEATAAYGADIGWGDGTSSSGAIAATTPAGAFTVKGSHSYAEEGSYTVTVVLHHDTAADVQVSGSITVSDPPVSASAVNFSAAEGQAFSNQAVATFTDPGGAEGLSHYSAAIDLGDGSPATAGAITYNAGSGVFTVSAGHLYAEEGSYLVRVSLSHDGAPVAVVQATATVADAPLTLQAASLSPTLAGVPVGPLTVATFQDADPGGSAGDFRATADWGDGSGPVAATVQAQGGGFAIVSGHTFSRIGTYTMHITVTDAGGSTAQASTTIAVPGAVAADSRSQDPQSALLVPVGEATADLNSGGLRLSHSLDFDQSPGTAVGGDPALVYNSQTVAVRPIVEVNLATDPQQPLPASVQVRLTWNGVSQGWVSFSTAGHQPGDSYLLAVQVGQPVGATGLYTWQAETRLDYGNGLVLDGTLGGQSAVVVRDQSPLRPRLGTGRRRSARAGLRRRALGHGLRWTPLSRPKKRSP